MDDMKDTRRKMYDDLRDELYKRQLSNSESFDKAILSLSSAGLAVSLTFLKFVVPFEKADYVVFLYSVWILFGLSIITIIASLISSQVGIDKQLEFSKEYYINEKEEFCTKKNIAAILTNWLNRISAIFFMFAIASMVAFIIMNFNQSKHASSTNEANIITDEKRQINEDVIIPTLQTIEKEAPTSNIQPVFQKNSGDLDNQNQSNHILSSNEVSIMTNEKQKINEGATIPTMQTVQKGAPVPKIQPVLQDQSTSQNSENQDNNQSQENSGNNEKPE